MQPWINQGICQGWPSTQPDSEKHQITIASERVRASQPCPVTLCGCPLRHGNSAVITVHDLHKVHWPWPLLLHPRKGRFGELKWFEKYNYYKSFCQPVKTESASWFCIFLHCIKFVVCVLIFYVFTFCHMIFITFMQMLRQMETIFVLFISFCAKGSRNVLLAKSRKSTEPVEGRTNPIQIMWLVLHWTHALTHWQTKGLT